MIWNELSPLTWQLLIQKCKYDAKLQNCFAYFCGISPDLWTLNFYWPGGIPNLPSKELGQEDRTLCPSTFGRREIGFMEPISPVGNTTVERISRIQAFRMLFLSFPLNLYKRWFHCHSRCTGRISVCCSLDETALIVHVRNWDPSVKKNLNVLQITKMLESWTLQ